LEPSICHAGICPAAISSADICSADIYSADRCFAVSSADLFFVVMLSEEWTQRSGGHPQPASVAPLIFSQPRFLSLILILPLLFCHFSTEISLLLVMLSEEWTQRSGGHPQPKHPYLLHDAVRTSRHNLHASRSLNPSSPPVTLAEGHSLAALP
jgi:hypothetical protein